MDVVKVKSEEAGQSLAEIEEEDFDDGWLEDEDGVEYYSDAGFRIQQVAPPAVIQRSLGELYASSRSKYMVLNPEYQRDVVWDEARASTLIASIFQGYFIPPIIFNVVSKFEPSVEGGGKKHIRHYRICIDGKQRLSSIQKFMEGKIAVYDASHPVQKWYYCHPIIDGREQISNRNILPEATKKFFTTRLFCCYEYSNIGKAVEETMFQLVQRGIPLTPAEKMRALSTRWASFGKSYEQKYFKIINLSSQGRASAFRIVITIFCQILEVLNPNVNKRNNREGTSFKPILQSSPQALLRFLRDDHSLNDTVEAKMKQVFDKFESLVNLSSVSSPNSKYGYKLDSDSAFQPAPKYLTDAKVNHVKTFSPLELLSTAILILQHMDSRTEHMLLGDIKDMRYHLRKYHKDLRINNQCWATAWDFIDAEIIKSKGSHEVVNNSGYYGAEEISNERSRIGVVRVQASDKRKNDGFAREASEEQIKDFKRHKA